MIFYQSEQILKELNNSTMSNLNDNSSVVIIVEDTGQDVYDLTSGGTVEKVLENYPDVNVKAIISRAGDDVEVNLKQAIAFLGVTNSLKTLSKCTRLKVCCVIEKDGRIVSTGINGTPKGYKNCNQIFTPDKLLDANYSAKHHEFSEAYEVHAEMNAILELGKNSSMDSYGELTLYCSTCPCPGCAKMIAQAGIKNVFYHEEYDRLPEGAKHLKEFGINVFKC